MPELSYTLITDGTSDRALIYHINWLLRMHLPNVAINSQWADPERLFFQNRNLRQRIEATLNSHHCDILFVHRDAEREPRKSRVDEILKAIEDLGADRYVPTVCVVPVRMLEAWLLLDERAIRTASGNPNGTVALHLPNLSTVEALPDPKEMLIQMLKVASGLSGRRLRSFSTSPRVQRVADLTDDFSSLRRLTAFRALEEELVAVLQSGGWID